MTSSKRIFDLVLALLLASFLVPILLGLLMGLLLRDGRPLFYFSRRMKTPDRAFFLIKIRTMRSVSADDNQGVTGGDKGARISRFGRFLRRSRLDEIPQLWNVVRGDISFVGPRPPLPQYVEMFPKLYGEVLKCRPGITGLATLVFHRHEERLLADCGSAAETEAVYTGRCIPRKARLDLIYQQKQSMCFDLWLMAKTAAGVFNR